MTEIKYHPLIKASDDGVEFVPMFSTNNEKTVKETHAMYLEEIIPRYYRLKTTATQKKTTAYKIHCPSCGAVMDKIGGSVSEHKLSLYACPKCK